MSDSKSLCKDVNASLDDLVETISDTIYEAAGDVAVKGLPILTCTEDVKDYPLDVKTLSEIIAHSLEAYYEITDKDEE